ncbi:MAG: sigma 54-interacting transcriptional regulator [Peptococcaceae bacterium]|nr:sigma 54-interacting transcriptional regulator [Peptococcaceae bacterium]MDH7525077.1 sigma 54-interacting transcriptional regulator [Peptococcaceae bacterium]
MDKWFLKEENELLMKIIDSSYDGIFITDSEGAAIYFNDAYLRISGLKREKILGRRLQDLVAENEIPDACSPEVIRTKKPVTKVIDYYNGVSALVTSIPVFNDEGRLLRVFSNVRDITDLLKLREELKSTSDLNMEYRQQLWQMHRESQKSGRFVVESPAMRNIRRLALRVSQVSSPVLIQGESGVGKDVLARYIHEAADPSSSRPFIQINCSAIPENLLESELFGYEPGAFTGAAKGGKRGLFELANDGTLFLDEIGAMPHSTQVKLLDVLQRNQVYRLGGTRTVNIDTRIIAATNSDLEKMVRENRFRQDLFYRLNVIPVHIPPLRERKEDIVPLVFHFLEVNNDRFGFQKKISPQALETLTRYDWPGNVRELKNLVERMIVLADGETIDEKCIPSHIKKAVEKEPGVLPVDLDTFDLKEIQSRVEGEVIKRALTVCGSMRKAARALGIDLSTLVRKKKKYNLQA